MSSRVDHRVDADGIGWIEFSGIERQGVILDSAALAGLRAALDALGGGPALAIVVASTDPLGFVSGPDLAWIASLRDPAGAYEYSRKGQRLFEALESIGVPTVCALHGACVGPGLELALACEARIAADEPRLKLGFGDVGSFVSPCWGGCVRLPRLVGAEEALERLLSGELLGAKEALERGYLEQVVPAGRLREAAKATALRAAQLGASVRLGPQAPAAGLYARMRERARGLHGARRAAGLSTVGVIERSLGVQKRAACEMETLAFGQLTLEPVWRSDVSAAVQPTS